jgi:cellulose synthase/poly-beta-1,6-N-acetylglucosamine synthase-like glycosyltransferase
MSLRAIVTWFVEGWSDFFLVYSCLLGLNYLWLCLVGMRETLRLTNRVPWQESRRRMQSPLTPPISLVCPAYNEASGILMAARSLLMLNYPEFELVLVNDGSKDDTLKVLIEHFDLQMVWEPFAPRLPSAPVRGVYRSPLHPNLVVVDKENAGCKADASNAGINLAKHPLVCIIDGDSMLDADALLRAVRPFVRDPERTVAVGGGIRIANGCEIANGRIVRAGLSRGLLPRVQTLEYLRAFQFDRMTGAFAGSVLIVSGAFGLFDREVVLAAGGFSKDTLGEDFDLVVRIHKTLRDTKRDFRVRFVPYPVCWTEVPATLKGLRTQRTRWHKGLLGTLWQHRSMFLRPKYGTAGMLAMPSFVLFEVLGPILELLGLIVLPLCWIYGLLCADTALALLLGVACMGISFTVVALILDDITFRPYPKIGNLLSLASAALLENVGYRQITAWWRVRATVEFLLGVGQKGWGTLERQGLGKA